jgi:NADPH2:quinone reductase
LQVGLKPLVGDAPIVRLEDEMTGTASRAVRFDRYGDRDVLYVADVPMPRPASDEVVVAVKAAGINPGEIAIRSGALHDRFPATFPSGEGSDLAAPSWL